MPKKIIILTLFLCTLNSWAAPDTRFMDVDEVKRGMTGYGLTVFQGMRIERFQVEILGVLKKTGASSDLILARLSGGPLATTGVIAGMSGSPVYLNGRMIGAVAYAWGYAKDTIAGITPIREMLTTFNYKQAPPAAPFRMEEGTNLLHGQEVAYGPATFRPVATPVILSGISPAVYPLLDGPLKKMGFLPVLGGAAGDDIKAGDPGTLEPGSAVGVQLVSGDMSITGIGTVTYAGPEGILAFGHPMMVRGFCSFPMTTAWIHTVMPSLQVSFKMGSPLKLVGTVNQDRQPAIAGTLGTMPDTIPVKMDVSYGGTDSRYSYTIIRDKLLFPKLLSTVMLNTLTEKSAKMGELSCRLEYRLTFEETASGKTRDVTFTDSWAALDTMPSFSNALAQILNPMLYILFNPWAPVRLKNVDIKVQSLPDVRAIQITDLRADVKKVRPGDTITLRVELTPWQGEPFWQTVSLKVPHATRNGKIFFVVSGKAHERFYDRFFAPARHQPATLDHLLQIFNMDRDNSKLVVWSELYQTGLIIGGQQHPDLPESQFKLFAGSQSKAMGAINARLMKEYKTNYYIYGMKVIFMEVDYTRW